MAGNAPSEQVNELVALSVGAGLLLGVSGSAFNSFIDDWATGEPTIIARSALIVGGLIGGLELLRRAAGIPDRPAGSRIGFRIAALALGAALLALSLARLTILRG